MGAVASAAQFKRYNHSSILQVKYRIGSSGKLANTDYPRC